MLKVDTVRTCGFEMNYMSFGQGERSFVVLPGLSVQNVTPLADKIAQQYKCLAKDYTVYLFDRRETVLKGYDTEDMARDTYAAMQSLGIKQADFCGISQGGMIALSLAVQFPSAVRKLVLASASDELTDELRNACREWIALAEAGNSTALALGFAEKVYSESLYVQYRDYFSSTHYKKEELDRFIILTKAILSFDLRDKSPFLTCPVFVLGAKGDRVMGAAAASRLAARTHAELYEYDAPYGHAVYDEAPDFLERVKAFCVS